MFRGFQSDYHAEILTAALLCVALALVGDVLLRGLGRLVTPWLRTGTAG
jgi:osmoprotectant transport system permease protein